jgi:restriction system protein
MELLALGALLVLVPYFLSDHAVGRALQALMLPGFGLVCLAAFLLARQRTAASAGATNFIETKPARATSKLPANVLAVPAQPATDRVADEHEKHLRKTVHEARSQVVGMTQDRWTRELFAQIEWRRFEAVVETLFSQAGFETRSQSHGADGGVDIWLHPRSAPATPVSIVQCKHWVGKRVGVDKVRELKGVMASHSLRRGHFATTSSFTPEAARFASDNGIHLLDIDAILRLIGMRPQADQRALLAVATEGEYWRPTCASCGEKLVERKPRSGGSAFWGCPSYPRCRTTMPMRADRARDAQPA